MINNAFYQNMQNMFFPQDNSNQSNVHQFVNLMSHPDHPHNNIHFNYDFYQKILTQIGDKKEWVNFIVNAKISLNLICYMELEIIQTAKGRINLGIGGNSILGKFDTLTAMEFATYSYYYGAATCAGIKY